MGWTQRLGPLLSLVIFAGALFLLHHLLQRFHLADVLTQLALIPPRSVQSGLMLTVASYLALGGFDGLAVGYLGRRLPAPKILLTSFVSHAVSHSTGFATLTGGAIRFRLYSAAGLSPSEVAAVVAFCGLTFGLGASSLAAVALLIEPALLSKVLHLPVGLLMAVGVGLATAVFAYVAWGATTTRPLRIFGRSFPMPRPGLAAQQIAVAAADLSLAAAALYVLLPEASRPSYPAFLGAYVVANLLGLLAHVPGGLGVFDAAILVLTPTAPPDAVLGALLMFRALYNLLPLGLAAVILLLYELLERLPKVGRRVAGTLDELGPPLLAALVFAVGGLVVLGHAVPLQAHVVMADSQRLVGAAEAAMGTLLMALARGLNNKVRSARLSCLGLLVLLALVVLSRDPFAPRALVLGILAVILGLAGDMSEPPLIRPPPPLSVAWALAVGAVVAGCCWMTWFQAHGASLGLAALRPSLLADGVAIAVYGLVLAAGSLLRRLPAHSWLYPHGRPGKPTS